MAHAVNTNYDSVAEVFNFAEEEVTKLRKQIAKDLKDKEKTSLQETLEMLSVFYPVIAEGEMPVKAADEKAVAKSKTEATVADVEKAIAPSIPKLKTIIENARAKGEGLTDDVRNSIKAEIEVAEKAITKVVKNKDDVKMSIFYLWMQVFGKEGLDMIGKQQMVGAIGLQEEGKVQMANTEALSKLLLDIKEEIRSGATSTMIGVASFLGPVIILSTLGAIAGGPIGFGIGLLVGLVVGAGLTAGFFGTAKDRKWLNEKVGDKFFDGKAAADVQNKQSLYNTLGSKISQEIQAIMQTQVKTPNDYALQLASIVNNSIEGMKKINTVR